MRNNLKLLLLLIILTIAAVGVAISHPQRINQPLPPALNRLPEAKLVEVKDESGQVILTGEFTTTSDKKKEIERTAKLTSAGAATSAKGKAEIELEKSGDTFSKQELEVALEGLAAGADFRLYVDGAEVIGFKTSRSGKAAMKFSSR